MSSSTEIEAIQAVFRGLRPFMLEQAGTQAFSIKADGSPVTDNDVAVEKTIFAQLKERFQDVPLYGEESGYDEHNLPERCWLVDPIDGTESFIRNVPAFTNMAVLIEAGEATAAVIYNPSTDEMYTAQKGQGAFKNGARLDLSKTSLAKIAYCKNDFREQVEQLLAAQHIACEKGPQGAGYGFAAVADGQVAARFNMRAGGYVHDYAPGGLLVREAGGVLLPIVDDTYTYRTRSFVACHPGLAEVLRPQITALRALEVS